MTRILPLALAATAFAVMAVPANADEPLENKIVGCFNTKNDQERLNCYDAAIQTEVQKYQLKQDVTRQEWSGNGMTTTRPFTMRGPWEFQWDAQGGLFQVMMYHKGEGQQEAMPQIIANQMGHGAGHAYVDTPGDYYLVVNAIGPWTAKAVAITQ